ncbi:T-complex protein 11-domain-containing protein [Cantharellus anzutake]|uniref:T-complex protein 11-domain-containing protein n=1 Tax=Cantharellus anzutake TaxID=1750568 RepID=UPI001903B80A|nr:T-complex protein 11-domain-containing protein [Cantharellus anzutake]KAF8333546.1 T-complex protein 11-domain-containing protein [Cantharellus anzutake]
MTTPISASRSSAQRLPKNVVAINSPHSTPLHITTPTTTCTSTPHGDPGDSPALVPPIRLATLVELDLESILSNVQLRHDLLFDPGLQFRPTIGRRKREAANRYWTAVQRELEIGCTCTSFDHLGLVLPCSCHSNSAPSSTLLQPGSMAHIPFSKSPGASRMPALIEELREILLTVMTPSPIPLPDILNLDVASDDAFSDLLITPLGVTSKLVVKQARSSATNTPPALATNPPPNQKSGKSLSCFPIIYPALSPRTSHQHRQVRAMLDVPLVLQQIQHGVFDPVQLLSSIGRLLKFHCAPIRDGIVNDMMVLAERSRNAGKNGKLDLGIAVQAIRRCFDVLELMRLDIANHQLQTLRPYLMKSAAQTELAAVLQLQQRGSMSLQDTRSWISKHLLSISPSIDHPDCSKRRSLVFEAVAEGIVDLVFSPPAFSPSTIASFSRQIFLPPSQQPSEPPPSLFCHQQPQQAPSSAASGYPETLWLDQTRLGILSADAADLSVLYMLILLFRQVVHSVKPSSSSPHIQAWELDRLKKEIWELGPERPGWRFFRGGIGAIHKPTQEQETRWECSMRDVTLQIGRRAVEIASKTKPLEESATLTSDHGVRSTKVPLSPSLLLLLEGWVETNLHTGSSLRVLTHNRLRAAILQFVRASTCHRADVSGQTPMEPIVPPGVGLEPLIPEIRHLSERIGSLVLFHCQVFGRVYEDPDFMVPC